MRHYDETAGEIARETSDASESRRWVLVHEEDPPRSIGYFVALAVLIAILLAVIARLG